MENFRDFFQTTGFATLSFGNVAMIVIGITFITLAIRKHYEPLLLVPIGMGIIVGNIPFSKDMQLGVDNQGAILVEDGQVLTETMKDSEGSESWMLNPLVSLFTGSVDDAEEGGRRCFGDGVGAGSLSIGKRAGLSLFWCQSGYFPTADFSGDRRDDRLLHHVVQPSTGLVGSGRTNRCVPDVSRSIVFGFHRSAGRCGWYHRWRRWSHGDLSLRQAGS